jgi:hypothetical protein
MNTIRMIHSAKRRPLEESLILCMHPNRAIPKGNACFSFFHGFEMGFRCHNNDGGMHSRNVRFYCENDFVVMHHRGHSRIFAIDDYSYIPSERDLVQYFHV